MQKCLQLYSLLYVEGITNGLSDAKRMRCSSVLVSPTTPHQSLLAAQRADVKSTSELVAQLTENLPGYLAINISQNHDSTGSESGDIERLANVVCKRYRSTSCFSQAIC